MCTSSSTSGWGWSAWKPARRPCGRKYLMVIVLFDTFFRASYKPSRAAGAHTLVMTFELSPHERELLPSPDDVRFYQEHGWFITPRIYSDDEIEFALLGSERYYSGERDQPLPDGTLQYGWSPKDGDGLRKNDYASLQNRELKALVRKPLLA